MIQKIASIGTATIGFVVGSENDLKIMVESGMFDVVEQSGITFELHIISADRNPEAIDEFCLMVKKKRQIKVIVTVAGLSAVLASAIKAMVGIIPVLAIPLDNESLSSNINKPKGTDIGVCGAPGKNACFNTTLLACEIVATGDAGIAEDLEAVIATMREEKQAQFDIDPGLVKEKYLKERNKNKR